MQPCKVTVLLWIRESHVAKTLMETPSLWSNELRNGDSVDWKVSGEGRKGELEKVTPKIWCMNHLSPLGLPLCM